MILPQLIKEQREKKGFLLREVASLIDADTALISKFEKGDRRPTREQVTKLSVALELEHNKLLKLWLCEKVYEDVKGEELAIDALKLALKRIKLDENK